MMKMAGGQTMRQQMIEAGTEAIETGIGTTINCGSFNPTKYSFKTMKAIV